MTDKSTASGGTDDPEAHAESADADSLTPSDTVDPDTNPRDAFHSEFSEKPEPMAPDGEEPEEADGEEPEEADGEEPDDAEPDDAEPDDAEPDDAEPGDDEATDLSDLVEAPEDDGIPEDYNPKKGLPSREWKKLPKSTQEFITRNQKYTKRLLREKEAAEPVTNWAQHVLENAKRARMTPEALSEWVDLGLRMQTGEAEAATAVLERAKALGVALTAPAQAPAQALKLDPVVDHLNAMVTDLALSREEAREIIQKIKQAVPAPEDAGTPAPAAPPAPAPATPAPPQEANTQLVEQAALRTIVEMEDRLAERHGEKEWPAMKRRIRDQMILENAKVGKVAPQLWPQRYAQVAKEIEKEHLAKSKRRTVSKGSQELGRGASAPSPSSTSKDPRAAFHRRFTT
jgi:hypothetical protein